MSLSGKPAINQPRGVASDLNLAINNIRERLGLLEAEVNANELTASSNTSVAAKIANLQNQINGLATAIAALTPTSGTGSGGSSNTVSLKAAEALSGFRVVYQGGPGQVRFVDPTTPTRAFLPLGVTTASSTAGASIPVQVSGLLSVGASIFTPGLPVWCGAGGVLTQTAPAAGVSIMVGLAVTPTQLVVAPQPPVLITAGSFNPPTDNLIAASRSGVNQGVAWQVGNVLIGIQPTVDFEAGAGLYWTASQDLASNRVILTINVGSPPAPNPLLTTEDPWQFDDWPEDSWPEWADDSQPRGANVLPAAVLTTEDPSVFYADDPTDDWPEWQQDARAIDGPQMLFEDPSTIEDDPTDDWMEWAISLSQAVPESPLAGYEDPMPPFLDEDPTDGWAEW